ncbi:PLP-dependent aminotransferase family protein [Nocardioides sp. SYSU D00038]|uniref:MocR-like pyridoxine biosynthesis transcription factor PdxR n=1 Tax=Nocardioides sp. SYSU D00038 TaxID=2812554 RepID=UPI0027DE21F6|nr:PLP-dependent aminotransferase family protein [Nocardioides sp. SYSU D00038]
MLDQALALTLDRRDPRPLGTQLADHVRARVTAGGLQVGERLPSSRALAAELGVARSVTEQAYAQLVAEGWLEGRHGSGTFVAAAAVSATRGRRPGRRPAGGPPLFRFDAGSPWIDPRHDALWRRAWREVSAARPPRSYTDPRGLPELREELAARLGRSRGLDVSADDVLVTAGTTDGLRHVLGALPPGPVGLEDPGYRAAAGTVRAAGRTVVDLPALQPVTDLAGLAAAYVTPAHQHPLGPTMPGAARQSLLAAATAAGALVVEDDYDSEFRYDVAPVPALASLDRDRVAYLGTASKTVDPTMRLGWLVAPPALQARIDEARWLTHDAAAWPVQRAFVVLLRDGYVDRVVRSARRVYAERAGLVADALGPWGRVHGPVAGMYATLEMSPEDTATASTAARRAGFEVPLLADYCRSVVRHGLILGFGGCTDDQLDRVLTAMVGALEGSGRG